MKKFIGSKAFYKSILIVALPLMAQQIITTAINLLDNLMVGQLGDAALGGVAVSSRYFMISIYSTIGVLSAAAVFLTQFFGANQEKQMKQAFSYSFTAGCVVMIPFVLIAALFPEMVIGFFSNEPTVLAQGVPYMRVAALANIPYLFTLILVTAMRAIGDTKRPLIAGVVSIVVNVAVDFTLIFGYFGFPAMGVVGGAIGTLVGRVIELLIVLYFFLKTDYVFKPHRFKEWFAVPRYLVKDISLKALPLTLNEIFWSLGMAMLLKFYATRGIEAMAGYSIAGTASDLFFSMFSALAVATTLMVGKPLGANKLDEARDNGYRMLGFAFMLATVLGISMFSVSTIAPNLFEVSQVSKQVATQFLQIMSVLFWVYMLSTECYFILRAGGDTRSTLFMDSGFMWLVNIPVVAAVTYFTGWPIIYIYLAGQLTDLLKLANAYRYIRKEKWVKNLTKVENEHEFASTQLN